MQQYCVTFGAYVPMYADHTVIADSDAARNRAIEDFKPVLLDT
jgi:hypothetical protein